MVATHFQKGLAEVQRTANLKGFRPGSAPLSVIKQFYGDDVRHRVYHSLIDETFAEAARAHQVKAVGRPNIETPDHKTGEGEHDHAINEEKDFTFIATVEVIPEIEVKGYTGLALTRDKQAVTEDDVEKVIQGMRESQAQLVPAASGLAMADGSQGSRPVRKGDFVELTFAGGLLTDAGFEPKDEMKGSRMLEIGSNSLIPGFEEEVEGMRRGETKTFKIPFPKDFYEKDFAGKQAEFTVTVNEVKEKKLPDLDDELAKTMGYESLADFRAKAKEFLAREREEESDRKLRSDLLKQIIEKNAFDVPVALVESQTRALAQDWAQELKRQGVDDATIQGAITQEIPNIRSRAENQVRASLLLESIAAKEKIELKPEDLEAELSKLAAGMKVEPAKLKEFYEKNPGRQEDLVFRVRQERTVSFLLDKAKIKGK
jgi:trigger factor